MNYSPAWHGVNPCPPISSPLLQIRKLSLREAKSLAQDYSVYRL